MVCTGNKDRSPTAAMVLAEMCAPMWVTSAGTEPWAKNQVSIELVEEADVICVMEEAHRRHIRERFGEAHAEKVVVLDIPGQLRLLGRQADSFAEGQVARGAGAHQSAGNIKKPYLM